MQDAKRPDSSDEIRVMVQKGYARVAEQASTCDRGMLPHAFVQHAQLVRERAGDRLHTERRLAARVTDGPVASKPPLEHAQEHRHLTVHCYSPRSYR